MLRAVYAILLKDLLRELRTKEIFSSLLLFAILVIVIFQFALTSASADGAKMVPGVIWITFTFAGNLGLARVFEAEKENRCLQGLMLAPVDRSAIFLGKFLAVLLFMLMVEAVLLAIVSVAFTAPIIANLPMLGLICLLGTIGFSALGVSLSAIASNTRMRDVLLPILLFPLLVPLVIFAVEATAATLADPRPEFLSKLLIWLTGWDLLVLGGSYMLFDYILED